MRKVIVLSALLLITGMSVYAQEDYSKSLKTTTTIVENADKYKVETNRFWSNWFVTAGGGGLIFFGDHNMQMKFGDRLSPALDIGFGKWFTPGIGIRFMYSGLTIKGATQNGSHSYRKSVRCFTMAGRTEIRLYEYSWRRAVQCLESALWL